MDTDDEDFQILSAATFAEISEAEDRDQDELLGAGSNFHWRIRITPPDTRRFALGGRNRRRDIIGVFSCNRLPYTIADFRGYLNSRCPNTSSRGFRLSCSVWPTSPYGFVPVQFSDDIRFSTIRGGEIGESLEALELEGAKYRRLIQGCRVFSRGCSRREVEFEIKIVFLKNEEQAESERRFPGFIMRQFEM